MRLKAKTFKNFAEMAEFFLMYFEKLRGGEPFERFSIDLRDSTPEEDLVVSKIMESLSDATSMFDYKHCPACRDFYIKEINAVEKILHRFQRGELRGIMTVFTLQYFSKSQNAGRGVKILRDGVGEYFAAGLQDKFALAVRDAFALDGVAPDEIDGFELIDCDERREFRSEVLEFVFESFAEVLGYFENVIKELQKDQRYEEKIAHVDFLNEKTDERAEFLSQMNYLLRSSEFWREAEDETAFRTAGDFRGDARAAKDLLARYKKWGDHGEVATYLANYINLEAQVGYSVKYYNLGSEKRFLNADDDFVREVEANFRRCGAFPDRVGSFEKMDEVDGVDYAWILEA